LLLFLVLEEAESAVCEVDDCADNNQRYYPVSQFVEHRETGTDKQFYQVITGPSYDGRDGKPRCGGKALTGSCN